MGRTQHVQSKWQGEYFRAKREKVKWSWKKLTRRNFITHKFTTISMAPYWDVSFLNNASTSFTKRFPCMVRILRRRVGQSQGLCLHTTAHHRNVETRKCVEWDSRPRPNYLRGWDPRLWPRGHYGLPQKEYTSLYSFILKPSLEESSLKTQA